ncbi:MAG: hypothetical protein QM706_09450 [Nitrospira sp.]
MRRLLVVLLVVFTCCSMLVTSAWSHSPSADPSPVDAQQGTAYGAGMEAASAAATILYFPFKAAFAIAGGIVGGLAYVFSGLNETTAKSIWIPSTFGTYVITPEHLTGDRPVRFLGMPAETEKMSTVPEMGHD